MKYAFYCFAKILTFYKPTSSFFYFFSNYFYLADYQNKAYSIYDKKMEFYI